MAVSNIRDRREETMVVRRTLAAAGIPAVVAHGRGTAWGWLEVTIGRGEQAGPHVGGTEQGADCRGPCPRCTWLRDTPAAVMRMVIAATGRSGGYRDGADILVLTQGEWCQRCRASYAVHAGHRHATRPAADAVRS